MFGIFNETSLSIIPPGEKPPSPSIPPLTPKPPERSADPLPLILTVGAVSVSISTFGVSTSIPPDTLESIPTFGAPMVISPATLESAVPDAFPSIAPFTFFFFFFFFSYKFFK